MKDTFRLLRRSTQSYAHNRTTNQRETLHTASREEAKKLLAAKNDAELPERTWETAMQAITQHGRESTRLRYARGMRDKALAKLKHKRLIETTANDLFAVLGEGTRSTNFYAQRLHNFALGFGWLPGPIVAPKLWPAIEWHEREGVTAEQQARIIAGERDDEHRRYYELLWHIGASQSDAANLTAEHVDWPNRVLRYQRAKLKKDAPPARITVGSKLEALLKELPTTGLLFPNVAAMVDQNRSRWFKDRCRLVGVSGVTLHSYHYAWVERAYELGMPERFAMANLGYSSKAGHRHYAKKAHVVVPALESFEKAA